MKNLVFFLCLLFLSCRQNICMGGDPTPPEVMKIIECAGEKWVEYVKSVNYKSYWSNKNCQGNNFDAGDTLCSDSCNIIKICYTLGPSDGAIIFIHELAHAETSCVGGENYADQKEHDFIIDVQQHC